MVLLVHGGPWSQDFRGCNPEVQLLANRGYAVVQVNFRGSIGFGLAGTICKRDGQPSTPNRVDDQRSSVDRLQRFS